jgi:chromosome partitioning protein
MRIISIATQKGGTGKTTTVMHLGVALARMGRTVLAIDMDKQGSLTKWLRVQAEGRSMAEVVGQERPGTLGLQEIVLQTDERNFFLAPAGELLAVSDAVFISRARREYVLQDAIASSGVEVDYILIDTPPGLGHMLTNSLVAADEVIVPTRCNKMDTEGIGLIWRTLSLARDLKSYTDSPSLELAALLPTFFRSGVNVHEVWLDVLTRMQHPDNSGRAMPVAPQRVPQTTLFEQASQGRDASMRTIYDLDATHSGSEAYMSFARYIDG